MGKWVNGIGCCQICIFYNGIWIDFVIIVNYVVFNYVIGVNFYVMIESYVVFDDNVSINFNIVFVSQCIMQIKMCWIVQYNVC